MMAPDPITKAIEDEERRDHAKAKQRGERLAHLTDAVLDAIAGQGIVLDRKQMRPVIGNVIADDIYGNTAIDLAW